MKNIIEANYFDGQSSASKLISILYDETMNELCLQVADGVSFFWQLDDLLFEQFGAFVEIRNTKYSGAILKIEDQTFVQKFHQAMKQRNRVDIHASLLNLGFSKIVAIAIGLFGLVVLAYFYVLPPLAEKSADLLPESFDYEIGNTVMETFINEKDIDTVKTKYLVKFASEMYFKNTKPLHFTVVKSDEVNAFALPNGEIVVYTGILKDMKMSDELVALLAHEASHVNHRHSTKMLCRNLAGYLLVSVLLSDVNGIMAVFAENAQQLHSLSYSRKFEQEADENGLKILIDNHVNPQGMVQLFEHLEKENKISIPKIISTHPLTKERKENMQRIITETAYEIKPNNKLKALFENIKK